MASPDDEEDDYLNMTFEDPKATKESSIARAARLKKESAARGNIPSKAVREKAAEEARTKALNTPLDSTTMPRGAAMMAKLGYKGGALGKSDDARTRPIEVNMKIDRGGIGADAEKKRKIREEAEEMLGREQKKLLTVDDFRQRNKEERDEKRHAAMFWDALRTLEYYEYPEGSATGEPPRNPNPPKSMPLVYRFIQKHNYLKEKSRQDKLDMKESLSRKLSQRLDAEEEDPEDKLAMGTEIDEVEDQEEDTELEEFRESPAADRLKAVLDEMRTKHHYCFWCKHKYENESMDGCPGLTEDDHD